MLEPWLRRHHREAYTGRAVVVSAMVHAFIVGAAVAATRRAADLPGPPLYNRIYYLPPPDARPQQDHRVEQLEYITLPVPGPEAGAGSREVGHGADRARPTVDAIGDRGRDYATTRRSAFLPGNDSIFTELEVDSAATRFLWSAAPAYPQRLLERHIEGTVRVQYIVDTTGFADTASFHVVTATDTGFASAVRAALPHMRFAPARIGASPVRQLVEQDFTFRIRHATTTAKTGRTST